MEEKTIEEKTIVIEDEVEFFNKYRLVALEHLLFYSRRGNEEPEYGFFENDGSHLIHYICKGYKAKAYFELMGNMRVYRESISYEVAD